MKMLISFGDADLALINSLEMLLVRAEIELEHDRTLMNGTAVAADLKRRLESLDGWIVALGHLEDASGWIPRDIVELLRLGNVIILPLYLSDYSDNPVYSALADRPGVPVVDVGIERAAELIANTFASVRSHGRIQALSGPARRRIGPSDRRYRLNDNLDWTMKEDLGRDERHRLIEQLASTFPTPSDAMPLLHRINFPLARIPAFVDSTTFWNTLAQDLGHGAPVAKPPFLRLLEAAVRIYRTNRTLREMAVQHGLLVVDDGQSDRGVQVLVGIDSADHSDELRRSAESSLRQLGLDPVERWSTSNAALYEVSTSDVDYVKSRIGDQSSLATAMVLSSRDPDYLIRQLFIEGSDGRRFRLTDVPAVQTGAELFDALEAFDPDVTDRSRQAVVELVDPDGQGIRLNPDQTLEEAGVADNDNLRLGYQANAGCFPGGALVLLADGSTKPIADLKEGDFVATSSRYRDRMAGAPVLRVVRYEGARCITINRLLTITPGHALFVNNNWMPAGDIRLGYYLVGADGAPIAVTSLETSSEDQSVYIPVLSPDHAGFFVEHVFVQNMVNIELYEEFRQSIVDPRSTASAIRRLAMLKSASVTAAPEAFSPRGEREQTRDRGAASPATSGKVDGGNAATDSLRPNRGVDKERAAGPAVGNGGEQPSRSGSAGRRGASTSAVDLKKGARISGAQRDKLASDLKKKYEKGASIRALAEQTGRTYGFVHRVLSESGVTLRGRGGATRTKKSS